jgi:PAS domain S-box-containing protein
VHANQEEKLTKFRKVQGAGRAVAWFIRPAHSPHEITEASGALVDLTGYFPEQLTGVSPAIPLVSQVHPDDRKQWDRLLTRALTKGRADCCFRLRQAHGRFQRFYELVKSTGGVNGSRILVSCLVRCSQVRPQVGFKRGIRDLLEGYSTALKPNLPEGTTSGSANSEEVRDTWLNYALHNANDGLWDWNLQTDEIYVSPRWKELMGYAEHELPNHVSTWERLVNPADRHRVMAVVNAYLAGQVPHLELEFRMQHKRGDWLHILSRGVMIRNASGKVVRLVGAHLDVTAWRKAERELAELNERLIERIGDGVRDHQTAVTALRQSESRLRLALHASKAAVWTLDTHSNETWWDARFSEQYGLEGTAPADHQTWLGAVHPDDRKRLVDRIVQLRQNASDYTWNEEFRVVHPQLGIRWMSWLGQVERDTGGNVLRIYGVNYDITDRRRVDEELRQLNETLEEKVDERTELLQASEERFRMLSAASFEGVMISHNGVIVDCNDQLANILACPRDDLRGQHFARFLQPELHGRIMQGIRSGAESHLEHEVLCADGSRKFVETRGRSPDGLAGMRITVVRDVSDRRRVEAEFNSQRTQLLHFQRLAELSEISAGIIHQIGQPLTAVLNNVSAAKMLVSRCGNAQCLAADALLDSDECLQSVQLIIDRLRALAHPEQARREMKQLNSIILQVVEMLQKDYQTSGVRLRPSLDSSLPPVSLDEVQISQTLINLLRNACEAVIDCELENRDVAIRTGQYQAGWLMIEVIDRGKGIASSILDRIFEPFFTTKPAGTGVGLSLCRTIIHAHGGRLLVQNNQDGPGAMARVLLPLVEPKRTEAGSGGGS